MNPVNLTVVLKRVICCKKKKKPNIHYKTVKSKNWFNAG